MNTEHKHDGTQTSWNRHNIHTDNYMNTEHKHDGTQTSWNRHNIHTDNYMNTQTINMMEQRHHGTDTTYIQITT